MAFNPIITSENNIALYQGEEIILILTESYSTLEFYSGQLKNRDKGEIFLTNARIIFIHSDITKSKQNFALHFNLITEEHYLEIDNNFIFQGHFSPYSNLMPSAGKFKLEFKDNFIEFKGKTMNFIRQVKLVNSMPISNEVNQVNQAFVDPANPDMMIMISEKPNKENKELDCQ